jgi:hypothetical protein
MIVATLEFSLLVAATIFIFIFAISRWYFGITSWSSLALAFTIGAVVLSAVFPMSSVYQVRRKQLLVGLYLLFYFFAFVVILTYVIERASHDQIPREEAERDICVLKNVPTVSRSMTDTIVF